MEKMRDDNDWVEGEDEIKRLISTHERCGRRMLEREYRKTKIPRYQIGVKNQ